MHFLSFQTRRFLFGASHGRAAVAWLALLACVSVAACAVDSRDFGVEPAAAGGSSASPVAVAGAGGGAASNNSANGVRSNPGGTERAGGAPFMGVPPAAQSDTGTGSSSDAGVPPVAPTALAVSGQVVDFYLRPVPNVPVTIGQTTVATDARGQFSVAEVQAPYTASLLVTYPRGNGTARYGYVYEGLTRNDPTLQVHRGLPERLANFNVSLNGADFTDPNREAIFALSTPDGSTHARLNGLENSIVTSWRGPSTIAGTARALLVLRSGASGSELPVAYEAQQAATFALSTNAAANVAFDLSSSSIAVANISGSVSGGLAEGRRNIVSLRFVDGTILPLLDDSQQTEAFSYLVPLLSGSSLSLAASAGFSAPFSLVHRENIAAGQAGVALDLPNPATLGSPQPGAVITAATPFTWSSPGPAARTFVWHVEYTDTFQGLFVITSRGQLALAELPDGLRPPPNTAVYWSVETHGAAPDVDAATGPSGFLDSYVELGNLADGPNLGDGSFTESERRDFSVSP